MFPENRIMQSSPLIHYTLNGLRHCYMPELGLWSYKLHFDGRRNLNESRPGHDVFYSLNVLLGLSKVPESVRKDFGLDPVGRYVDIASRLQTVEAPRYAYGMALWAAAELGVAAPDSVVDRIRAMAADADAIAGWRAQELGLTLSGAAAQARFDPYWKKLGLLAKDRILNTLASECGLFRDCAIGPRKHFASFATHIYCSLGLYQWAEAVGDEEAARAADACVARLIALQGARGEWPWFYHVASGRVVDFYEIYSVHQHGMAPAVLKYAIKRQLPGAREALSKGFEWILGRNEMGATMLRPELSLIARSQARRGLAANRFARIARATFNAVTGQEAAIDVGAGRIFIRPEVRSYELGWTLWSFGDDLDFPQLTQHEAFSGRAGMQRAPVELGNIVAAAQTSA
jgi:hypothetical protein